MTASTLPPGPRRPALAQTLQWVFDPERFMRRCRERYGSTFTARLGPSADVVFLCEPEDVKTVFRGTPEQTNMGDINGLFRRVLGTNSLLVIDGDEHLRQRRLLLPPFNGERIAEHYGAMLAAAEEDVATWQEGQTLTLQPHMQAMTLNVILAAVFGLGPGERRDRFRVLLSLLLDAQDADGGDAMTDRELRDQLLTMLVAGHETTATALAWAFERLLRNPTALVRATAELAQGSTTYLDAAIKETLRLRPVVPITARKITVPFEVGGRTYEPGTVLMPCIYLLHRHPDIYERPEEFLPERFIGQSPPGYAWIPFGGGVRRCLGSGFALAEMRAVMQTVLTRVELRPEQDKPERVVRRAFTISPREGARVVVQQRLG